MTGSLQRKHGKYYAVINLTDVYGNRKQKWINSGLDDHKKNQKLAQEFLEAQIKVISDKETDYIGISFSDYLEKWLETIKLTVRPNTYRSYYGNMKNHIIPYFKANPVEIQDITPMVLESYYYSLLKPNSNLETGNALSPTTIRHHHQNISKALSDAIRNGYIKSNPAASVKLPKKKNFKPIFLNSRQLNDLINLFEGTFIELPVKLSSVYGLRRSEVLGLKWKYVDFENRKFTIAETLQQGVNGNYENDTKTESSFRTMPMTKQAYEWLRKQKQMQELNCEFDDNYITSDYVCTKPNGEVITPNYLSREFHRIILKSDLPTIRFHDLRHSVASNLINNGFSIVQVQQWLGHSSASTTLNYYAHADKMSKIEIANSYNKREITNNSHSKVTVNKVKCIKTQENNTGKPFDFKKNNLI